MGLAQKSSSRTFVKIAGLKKGSDKVYFTTSVKGEDGKWGNQGEFPGISGYFKGFSITDKEYDGNKYKEFQLTITDAGEDFCLTGSLNSNIWRGIVNTLAGSSPLGWLEFSVGVNKKGYPSCWIKNGGENTEWAISWEKQTELVDTITNKKGEVVSRDYDELIEALVKAMSKVEAMEGNLIDSIPEDDYAKMETAASQVEASKAKAKAMVEGEEDDDLPF